MIEPQDESVSPITIALGIFLVAVAAAWIVAPWILGEGF
jgi:hypothetical protein